MTAMEGGVWFPNSWFQRHEMLFWW